MSVQTRSVRKSEIGVRVFERQVDTRLRVLMVYTPQCPCVQKELVERTAVHPVRVCRNGGFLGEDDLASDGGVDREHPPVHEPAIPKVRIVDLFCCPFQYFMHQALGCLRLRFEYEKLDGGGEQCQLDLFTQR